MHQWRISGPYFESCNCDPICPCRRVDGRTPSGVDLCQFALAWSVQTGRFDGIDLSGRRAVIAGYWDFDGKDGWPWRVGVYVDSGADDRQREILAGILTGKHGGTPSRRYAGAITEVLFVEPAQIEIDHEPGRQFISVRGRVDARARAPFATDSRVSCGISGHDREGYEVIMEGLTVQGGGLDFAFSGNCGYASTFDYRSDGG